MPEYTPATIAAAVQYRAYILIFTTNGKVLQMAISNFDRSFTFAHVGDVPLRKFEGID